MKIQSELYRNIQINIIDLFICNEKLWNDIQYTLGSYLAGFKVLNTYMYSKAANGYVEVGATFSTYNFAGKQIAA